MNFIRNILKYMVLLIKPAYFLFFFIFFIFFIYFFYLFFFVKRNAPARISKQRRIEWPHAISVLLAIRNRRNAAASNKKNTKKKERKNKQRYPVNFKHIFFYHSFFSIEFTVVLCSDDNLKAPARSHLHAYTIMCGVNFRTPSLNPQKNNREVIFLLKKDS